MDLLGGADGNLWLTGGIGLTRVGTDFSVAAFPPASRSALANGPDGNVWYTGGATGLATVSTSTGFVTERTLTGEQPPFPSVSLFVTTGPDGNVWLTGATYNGSLETPGFWNWIGSYGPSGEFTEFRFPALTGLPLLGRITAGPDGNVWFTEPGDYDHPGRQDRPHRSERQRHGVRDAQRRIDAVRHHRRSRRQHLVHGARRRQGRQAGPMPS